jgi:hypothetical protein
MAFKHPLDPPIQWAAAATFGKLIAQHLVDPEDVLPQLVEAAVKAGYTGDRSGLQARLIWHVTDTVDHWSRERDRVEYVIRRELAPMLAALADGQVILRSAQDINEREHEPLLRREVQAIVEAEMAALIMTMRRSSPINRRRRHAR